MTTKTTTDFGALWQKAHEAGLAAADAAVPTPIIVGEAKSLFSNEIDHSKPTYYVPQGLCGFAWIQFKGNTAFGRWAKKAGKASPAYGGGLSTSVRVGGQSIEIKEAYARAFAAVLNEAGITAYAESRLD